MAKSKSNFLPFAIIGIALFYIINGARNIPENISVGITKIRNVNFNNFPDLFIGYDMQIINFNNFTIPIQGVFADIYFGKYYIGQVISQQNIVIPANGRQFINLDIQASLISLGVDIYSTIKNQTALEGKLTIRGKIFSNGIGFPFEKDLF